MDDVLLGFVFGVITAGTILLLPLDVVSYNEVVEKTDACYIINENHQREFKWSCEND